MSSNRKTATCKLLGLVHRSRRYIQVERKITRAGFRCTAKLAPCTQFRGTIGVLRAQSRDLRWREPVQKADHLSDRRCFSVNARSHMNVRRNPGKSESVEYRCCRER